MTWCQRCGDYSATRSECQCRLLGRIWKTKDGEADAHDLWSTELGVEDAIETWACRKLYEDFEFMQADESVSFSFRPAPGGPVQFVNVLYELAPSFSVDAADKDDDTVESARKYRASTLRSRRQRMRAG